MEGVKIRRCSSRRESTVACCQETKQRRKQEAREFGKASGSGCLEKQAGCR